MKLIFSILNTLIISSMRIVPHGYWLQMSEKLKRCVECGGKVSSDVYECGHCARRAYNLWWLTVGSLSFISAAFVYLIFLY